MEIKENTITTTIVNSDDNLHNYEISRIMSGDGVSAKCEAALITICPSTSAKGDFKIDSTTSHLLGHLSELGICKLSVFNLFSKITDSRMSSRNLMVDEENMNYIESRFKDKKFATTKLILAWGSSLEHSDAAQLSKKRIIQMYMKYHPNKPMYELTAEGMSDTLHCIHPLYLGVNTSHAKWSLTEYQPPKDLMEYESKKKVSSADKKAISKKATANVTTLDSVKGKK